MLKFHGFHGNLLTGINSTWHIDHIPNEATNNNTTRPPGQPSHRVKRTTEAETTGQPAGLANVTPPQLADTKGERK